MLIWLVLLYASIYLMVVIGGTTRLTASGLSMVEWKPLMGTLPPMGEAEWLAAFDKYKQFPQYQQVNAWMELADFKKIFFWEYLHRLWGRTLGLIFFVPWMWFVARRQLRGPWIGKTFAAFVLGGAQGLLGWYMVKSGLVDVPQVSHFRLASHLMLAAAVANYVLWMGLEVRFGNRLRFHGPTWAIIGLVALQVVWGAFMAGSQAGTMFTTFPLMDGRWVPEGLGAESFLYSQVAIHFTHRMLAYLVVVAIAWWAWAHRGEGGLRGASWWAVVGLVVIQFVLGVATVLGGVPVGLGVMHQAGGVGLLSATVFAGYAFAGSSRAPASA